MAEFKIDERLPIMVELAPSRGVQKVSLKPKDIIEKSEEAINNAMSTVYNMAGRLNDTVEKITSGPSGVEVSFGLKLDTEAGVFIAKAGMEASINVTLKWQK